MIVVLTNIPTPYRTAFFNEFSALCKSNEIDLHVLYCAKSEPRRFWTFNAEEQRYNYTFLDGIHPNLRIIYPHINWGIKRTLKILKPKLIIFAGSWNTPTMIYTLNYTKNKGIKRFFWSEGHEEAVAFKSSIIGIFRKVIYNKFDGFLVPNRKSKDFVLSLLNQEKPISFLPNTIDEEFFKPDLPYDVQYYRELYKINKTKICICILATLNNRKGVREFLTAYNSLESVLQNKLQIVYAGTGELYDEMSQYIAHNNLIDVYLLGHVSKEQIKEILYMSDIFALPTKLDPNPLTPIEASFMAKPIMLSQKAGNFDEIMTGENGIEICKVEEHAIILALKEVCEISNFKLLGENSRRNAINKFSRHKVCMELLDFIKPYL